MESDSVRVVVQPEIAIYIPRKEYENGIKKVAASNFKEYYPTLQALCTRKTGLQPNEVSSLTNRSLNREITILRRLRGAGFIDMEKGRYIIKDDGLDDMVKAFGDETVLLSASFMTDEERALSYNIINIEL